MAFRRKAHKILKFKPDILVVQESENPLKWRHEIMPDMTDNLWFGENQNKGLAIYAFGGFKLCPLKNHNQNLKLIVPVRVRKGNFRFTLFAVWANNPDDPDGQYVTQVWKAINFYQRIIKRKETLIIGDFNSNTIWDKPRREGNHTTIVEKLSNKGIHSLYHLYFEQIHGSEMHPTLYMYRHKDKPYHIDYCFASQDFSKNLESVTVGKYHHWIKYSDHAPLVLTFFDFYQ